MNLFNSLLRHHIIRVNLTHLKFDVICLFSSRIIINFIVIINIVLDDTLIVLIVFRDESVIKQKGLENNFDPMRKNYHERFD